MAEYVWLKDIAAVNQQLEEEKRTSDSYMQLIWQRMIAVCRLHDGLGLAWQAAAGPGGAAGQNPAAQGGGNDRVCLPDHPHPIRVPYIFCLCHFFSNKQRRLSRVRERPLQKRALARLVSHVFAPMQ
jgi:hypothetical protein